MRGTGRRDCVSYVDAECCEAGKPDWNGDWDDQIWTCPTCGKVFHMVHDECYDYETGEGYDYHYWMPGPYP